MTMTLSGTLDTFTVGEILSLLGSAKTTGALRVWSGDERGEVYCRDGEVTFAAVGANDGLGDVLVRAGFVPPSDWSELEALPDPAAQLSETLARAGIDVDRVQRFIAKQTEESVFELDGWTAGELRFDLDVDHALSDFFRYPTSDLLESVSERHVAWTDLLERIGSADRIVHQAPVATDDDNEVSVSRTQLALVSQVDGRRSIRELARFLGTGLFQTCEVVADLVAAGLVVLRDERLGGAPAAPAPAPATAPQTPPPPPPPAPTDDGAADDGIGGVTEFVEPGDGPARDLILRLLSAVKEEL